MTKKEMFINEFACGYADSCIGALGRAPARIISGGQSRLHRYGTVGPRPKETQNGRREAYDQQNDHQEDYDWVRRSELLGTLGDAGFEYRGKIIW